MAGEAIFLLPFVLTRIFRHTFLTVFELTNTELGSAFSVYGVVAMISYVFGGPIADRFSARSLMIVSLITTALGGFSYVQIPSVQGLMWIYGFWGLTSILLFWAALIKATREWGGDEEQGQAFGLLDAGRGLLAAVLASFSVWVFAQILPANLEQATLEQKTEALQNVIYIFSAIGFFAAALVWFLIPATTAVTNSKTTAHQGFTWQGVKKVAKMPSIWLQSVIIICAYTGYKCTDDFSLYAQDAFGYDDVAAAKVGTVAIWMRPFAALGAGLLADRFTASRMMLVSFVCVLLGSLVIASGWLPLDVHLLLVITVASTSAGICALRGLYFAIMEEAQVPLLYTGSAVGIVSFLGYTPDVFLGPLMGYLLDRSPGALGHQHLFATLAGFSVLGLVCAWLFRHINTRKV